MKIALTATPALHTTEIFGQPVFKYTYREAVIEGYLVDHDAPHHLETKLSTGGIRRNVLHRKRKPRKNHRGRCKKMSKFTVEEINFMCVFETQDRTDMIGQIRQVMPHIKDSDMEELGERVPGKFQSMTGEGFAEVVLESVE